MEPIAVGLSTEMIHQLAAYYARLGRGVRIGAFTVVEAGADIETPDANGITPLLGAIINKSLVAVRPGMGAAGSYGLPGLVPAAEPGQPEMRGGQPHLVAVSRRRKIVKDEFLGHAPISSTILPT